ncbi:guanine nucleotide-binding protein subunit alpha-11 [Aplysia californica]|uniref:Guanine nucleotide-binding protein subunit alpha-11 n=1 Tax=Aplysia californica TaxID=6500 RepID=A0ABM0K9M4_APLCA|nr:guanine nucleotide-binding protein subunit alpha-11 [Aplysia californica]
MDWFSLRLAEFRERRRRRAIDERIRHEKNSMDSENVTRQNFILLGFPQSGKSTFLKQLRILHGGGYTESQRREMRTRIYQMMVAVMKLLVEELVKSSVSFSDPVNEHHRLSLDEITVSSVTGYHQSFMDILISLWNDDAIKKSFQRQSMLLPTSTKYFFDNLSRISGADYVPTEHDVLMLATPTTSVEEHVFEIDTKRYRMTEPGGQRPLSTNWFQLFADVNCMLYFVDLSGFDQPCPWSDHENALEGARALFATVSGSRWFCHCTHLVMFSRQDVMKEKLLNDFSSFQKCFPDYTGPSDDCQEVFCFIQMMFIKADASETSDVHCVFVNLTDTHNTRFVFQIVQDILRRPTRCNCCDLL